MTRISVLISAIAASLMLAATGPANAQSHIQFSNVIDFNTGAEVAGAGYLTRTEDEVRARLTLSDLDKKAAYTFWWVVFNNPAACAATPCGLGDLGNPAVDGSVLWAGGVGTGTDGTANVSVHLSDSGVPAGSQVLFGPALMPGNGLDAEIHMIVRSHGKYVVGSVDQQIGSVGGACDVNLCEDQQAVIFLPAP